MSDTWSSLSGVWPGYRNCTVPVPRQWEVWDETDDPELVEYAKNQCLACPVLAECRSWFESLRPSKRPIGTVAGQLVDQHRKVAA